MSIPKIFMQTWKTHIVPDKWKSSPESVRKYMPQWKYFLMSDEENRQFCQQYFPDFLDVYDNLEFPIMRADAIRYMWLYINGGIYMDLDDVLVHPLDDLFTSDADAYFVKSGNSSWIYTNSFLASKPGCPIWLECIEAMKKKYRWWMIGKHLKIMYTTGPSMLHKVLKETKHPFATLPTHLINPCSICDSPCLAEDSYVLPLEGRSWCGWDTLAGGFIMCKWKKIVLVISIILVVLIIWLIIKRSRRYRGPK